MEIYGVIVSVLFILFFITTVATFILEYECLILLKITAVLFVLTFSWLGYVAFQMYKTQGL